jgi:hypothetical protein
MLDCRFRQAANLFRISIALIACGTLSHAIAHDEPESYFIDGFQDAVAEHLCSDQHFLNKAKLGAEACKEAIESHVEECWAIVEPLEPDLFHDESDFSEENTKKHASLANVYLMCLQSRILLSTADGN